MYTKSSQEEVDGFDFDEKDDFGHENDSKNDSDLTEQCYIWSCGRAAWVDDNDRDWKNVDEDYYDEEEEDWEK